MFLANYTYELICRSWVAQMLEHQVESEGPGLKSFAMTVENMGAQHFFITHWFLAVQVTNFASSMLAHVTRTITVCSHQT